MDQEKLVRDEIDAGAALAQRVSKTMPIQAAFWLYDVDQAQWYLYFASDRVPDQIPQREGYGRILEAYNESPSLYLDPLQVKLLSLDSPLAHEAVEMSAKYPSTTVTRINRYSFGGLPIAGGYLYPPTIIARAPSPATP